MWISFYEIDDTEYGFDDIMRWHDDIDKYMYIHDFYMMTILYVFLSLSILFFKTEYLSFMKTNEYSITKKTQPTMKGRCGQEDYLDTTCSCSIGRAPGPILSFTDATLDNCYSNLKL